MEKDLQKLEEGLKAKIHIDLLRETLKKILNSKTPYMDTGLKNSLPSMRDWLSK